MRQNHYCLDTILTSSCRTNSKNRNSLCSSLHEECVLLLCFVWSLFLWTFIFHCISVQHLQSWNLSNQRIFKFAILFQRAMLAYGLLASTVYSVEWSEFCFPLGLNSTCSYLNEQYTTSFTNYVTFSQYAVIDSCEAKEIFMTLLSVFRTRNSK